MSKPRDLNIGVKIKTLMTTFPGKTAVLMPENRPMQFKNAQAALAWCESNGANFFCMQPDRAERN